MIRLLSSLPTPPNPCHHFIYPGDCPGSMRPEQEGEGGNPTFNCRPLRALSTGDPEMLWGHEKFTKDVGLRTKLLVTKFGACFPGSGWSQTCPGSPADLGSSRNSCSSRLQFCISTGHLCTGYSRFLELFHLWSLPTGCWASKLLKA